MVFAGYLQENFNVSNILPAIFLEFSDALVSHIFCPSATLFFVAVQK
jgi:hypothetical protein